MAKKPRVTQEMLARYVELEAAVAEHKLLHEELKVAVVESWPVQKGKYNLFSHMQAGQRRPAWKQHATGLAERFKKELNVASGDVWAQTVVESTKPGNPSLVIFVAESSIAKT